jgi:hypothetical protein
MSTVFSEQQTAIQERHFAIVPDLDIKPMPPSSNRPLQEFVLRVMRENSLSYPDVERMARRRGGTIGKSSIQSIAKGETENPGINTLVELAWGLSRPVEEVVSVALGNHVADSASFRKSDFANLWDLYQELPAGEQRILKRYLQMMEREMRRVLMQLTESDQLVSLPK